MNLSITVRQYIHVYTLRQYIIKLLVYTVITVLLLPLKINYATINIIDYVTNYRLLL